MQIIGRVTKDAQVNTTKSGKNVVTFNVAVNDYYRKKGSNDPVQVTNYYRCSYWLNADAAKRLKKGVLVELEGRIGIETYLNKNGQPSGTLTLNASRYKVHTKTQDVNSDTSSYMPMTAQSEFQVASVGADDLPF